MGKRDQEVGTNSERISRSIAAAYADGKLALFWDEAGGESEARRASDGDGWLLSAGARVGAGEAPAESGEVWHH